MIIMMITITITVINTFNKKKTISHYNNSHLVMVS